MIVWLASYPRSGNTFLWIVLHRLYGVPTYSVYNDDDLVAQQAGAADTDAQTFAAYLRAEITRPYLADQPSSGTWGGNVLSWLNATDAPVAVLRYEDLIIDPRGSVTRVVSALLPELVLLAQADLPSFAELRRVDAAFFRRGAAHSYRDEMPEELHELFWAQAENATAMQRLGYER